MIDDATQLAALETERQYHLDKIAPISAEIKVIKNRIRQRRFYELRVAAKGK